MVLFLFSDVLGICFLFADGTWNYTDMPHHKDIFDTTFKWGKQYVWKQGERLQFPVFQGQQLFIKQSNCGHFQIVIKNLVDILT